MRYRVGEEPQRLADANQANDGMFVGTAIYGVILGIGFIIVGFKVKQRWLAFWGAGLSIASAASIFVMH